MGGPLTVADVLERAADLIEPEGKWAQGMFGIHAHAACMCAVGAIGNAVGVRNPREAEDWVDINAASSLGMDAEQLELWNDAADRTQAEVVAKLREAAAISRALPGGEGK